MLWSPKCSCQFLWRQIVIVMFTASQIKSSTHVSSSPKSKSVPSLLHVRTKTHRNNLYGSLDLLCPPPFYAPHQSPTSGYGQSPESPRGRLWWPPKSPHPLPGIHEEIHRFLEPPTSALFLRMFLHAVKLKTNFNHQEHEIIIVFNVHVTGWFRCASWCY